MNLWPIDRKLNDRSKSRVIQKRPNLLTLLMREITHDGTDNQIASVVIRGQVLLNCRPFRRQIFTCFAQLEQSRKNVA